MTHAFFKALLFLAAGSVIIGLHHDQDIRNMGGLRKYMPITWITFLVGSLALIGTPFFAGFYSKDSIIEAVHASHLAGAGFAYVAVAAGVFVTAFYSFRMYFLVFHGEERFRHKPFPPQAQDEHAVHDEVVGHGGNASALHAEPGAHGDEHHDPHESPWVVTVPLVLLAIPSVVIGAMTVGPMLHGKFFADAITVFEGQHPAMDELGRDYHGWFEMALQSPAGPIFWLALAGVALSWYFYLRRPDIPAMLQRRFAFIYKVLDNKYYFDWFNEMVLSRAARMLGTALWKGGDVGFIDGVVIDGSASTIGGIARAARLLQSGYLYWYALVMIIGVIGLMTWQLWPSLLVFFGR
jgi:NADH-quinone oxidoreductase subunit L